MINGCRLHCGHRRFQRVDWGSGVPRCWQFPPFWLPLHLHSSSSIELLTDQSVASTDVAWSTLSSLPWPHSDNQHIQKVWDKLVTERRKAVIHSRAPISNVDKKRPNCWQQPLRIRATGFTRLPSLPPWVSGSQMKPSG